MDANQRARRLDRVGATTDLDSARPPWISAREIVDHDRRAPAPLDVAELLRLRKSWPPISIASSSAFNDQPTGTT